MRLFEDICLFVGGLLISLFCISVFRLGSDVWSSVQLPVIGLVLAVFFLNEGRLAALTAGLGLGLDLVSSYPFLTWTLVLGGTILAGWWLSKAVLTNRSLPSLMLLGLAMHLAYFALESGLSRLSGFFGGTVWYSSSGLNVWNIFAGFGLELVILALFFVIQFRFRHERARMLTHL